VATDAHLGLVWSGGVLSVAGDIDGATVAELRGAVDGVAGPLVLNLDGVEFMDSHGVHALVDIYARQRERGEVFRIESVSRCARRILDICSLLELFTDTDSE
jgi:anti-anti-sigma factor